MCLQILKHLILKTLKIPYIQFYWLYLYILKNQQKKKIAKNLSKFLKLRTLFQKEDFLRIFWKKPDFY